MEDVQGNFEIYFMNIQYESSLTIKKNLLLNLLYMLISSQSEELSYRLCHETLPRASAFVNWISVRFYETDFMYTINVHMGKNLFMSIEYSFTIKFYQSLVLRTKLKINDWSFRGAVKKKHLHISIFRHFSPSTKT